MGNDVTFIVSRREPWRSWNTALGDAVRRLGKSVSYLDIDEYLLPRDVRQRSLYVCRTNDVRAIALVQELEGAGVRVLNGKYHSRIYPRAALLEDLARRGISVPRHYLTANMAELVDVIPDDAYPLMIKSLTSPGGEKVTLDSRWDLIARCLSPASCGTTTQRPLAYYAESVVKGTKTVKVYFLGEALYSFANVVPLGEHSPRLPVEVDLPHRTRSALGRAVGLEGLDLVSADCVLTTQSGDDLEVVDVNLVPMMSHLRDGAHRMAERLCELLVVDE